MRDSFFRNAFFLATAEVIARLKALVFLPLLTHHLGTVNFGAWSQVTLLVSLATPLATLVSENGIIRTLPGLDKSSAARRFSAWLIFLTCSGCVTTLAIMAAQGPLGALLFDGERMDNLVPLSIAVLWVSVFTNSFKAWLRVENDARALSAFTLLQSVVSLVALATAISQEVGVFGVVLYLTAGDAVVLLAMAATLQFKGVFARPEWGCLPGILRFSLPLLPAAYALWAVNFIDRIFLVQYQGLETVGAFSFVYSLAYMIIQVAIAPIWAMFPNLAAQYYNSDNYSALQQLFNRSAGTLFFIGAPAVGGIAIVAYDLVSLIGGAPFASAADTMPFLLAGYIFLMLSAYFDVAAGLDGAPSRSTAAVGTAVAVNLVLNILLIPTYGIMGAAWATLAAYVSQFTYIWMATRKRRLFVISMPFLLRISALTAAMTVTAYLVKALTGSGIFSLVATIVSGSVFYIAGALFMGLFSLSAFKEMRDIWR